MKVSIIALVFTLGFAGAPALAQQNQAGLVNIAIDDVNVTVPIQAAVKIAANLCGINLLSVPVGTTVGCEIAQSGKQVQFTKVEN